MTERDEAINELFKTMTMAARAAHIHHLNEETYRVCLAIIAGEMEPGLYCEREEFNLLKPVLTPMVPIAKATPRQPWYSYDINKERALEYVRQYGAIRHRITGDTP